MNQGEIWYANFSLVKESEQAGHRPVLIISGNLLNEYLPVIICFPLTTKIKNYRGNLVLKPDTLNNLPEVSEGLTFHIRSVVKERLQKKIGSVRKSSNGRVEEILK